MRSLEIRIFALLICVGIALGGCSSPKRQKPTPPPTPQTIKHAPPTPLDMKKAELDENTWNPQWDQIIEQALPPALLSGQVPRDVRRFCPRFYVLSPADKRAFWAYFFQALSGAEASLNPRATVQHTDPLPAPNEKYPVLGRTEGLLQLSYKDRKRYGCDFDAQADSGLKVNSPDRTILDPKNNLTCGVKILVNQIIDQHKPLVTRSSYWVTLQPGTISHRNFAKQMTNVPAACGLHSAAEHSRTLREQAER